MPALSRTLILAIDTETTGTDVNEDRIIELGGAYLLAGAYHPPGLRALVNPDRYIPASASNVHGIRNEDVEHAPAWPEVAAKFKRHLDELNPVVVGYNILWFDARIINAENTRHDLGWSLPRSLDPFVFANWHHRDIRSRKLALVAELYGVTLPDDRAHTADADSLAVGLLLLRMVEAGLIPDDVEAAFQRQQDLIARMKAEEAELGRALFRDRKDGETLRIGIGKHTGVALAEADEDFLKWLGGRPNLTDEARRLVKRQLGQVEQMGLF
ncbi:MAG: 3'-5' exonuclease [Myxococcales bacterium]|nr:3'-5' exonuclease [Myxococcales bacterium]MCB9525245.1 3'-5' exonuclease [Myxococcales bacterium]